MNFSECFPKRKVLLNYTKLIGEFPCGMSYDLLLSKLPDELIEKNLSYKKWQDRYLNLFGKLLLIDGLDSFGIHADKIKEVRYNKFNRPFLPNERIDFNISHSGNYVACVIGVGLELGIDIEIRNPIDLSDFEYTMTSEQWKIIMGSENPGTTFYRYWTIKEGVIKASSFEEAFMLSDIQIDLSQNTAQCLGRTWYVHDLVIDKNYSASLVTSTQYLDIEWNILDYYSLVEQYAG